MIEISEQILTDINRNFIIPPKPEILSDLQNLADQESPSIADAAEVVVKDLAISSAILKIINSPAYGLARTVSDIKQAVMFLGWDGVNALVQGLKLKQMFSTENSCISLERFWDTTTDIANVNMIIGKNFKKQIPIEFLYTLGLFHDCGVPPMAIKFHDYLNTLHMANQSANESLIEIEEVQYNTNHAVVGYYFSNSWHLPKDICHLILNHHNLSLLDNLTDSNVQISFAILKMSENLVNKVKRGNTLVEWKIIEEKALDVLCLSDEEYLDLQEDVIDYFNDQY